MSEDKRVAWLREQITARLARARAASEGPWDASVVPSAWAGFQEAALAPTEVACVDDANDYCLFVALQFTLPPEQNAANAAHIAANDPQDAIARCEAELALLGKIAMMDERDAGYLLPDLASGYRHKPGYGEHWPGS